KAVEDEPSGAVQALAAFPHHLPDSRIGHKFAPAHIGQSNLHVRSLLLIASSGRGAENIAGRKMAGNQPLVEQVGLRPIARAGRSDQDNSPRLKLPFGGGLTLARRPLQQGSAAWLVLAEAHGPTLGPLRPPRCEWNLIPKQVETRIYSRSPVVPPPPRP